MTPRSNATILVVEDDDAQRKPIVDHLRHGGYKVIEAENAPRAMERLRGESVDVVVTDLRMPSDPWNGLDLVRWIKRWIPTAGILVLTYCEDISCCVEAMQSGAHDYLVKPPSFEALDKAVERLLVHVEGRRNDAADVDLIADSPAMKNVLQMAQRCADYDEPVLITGETGTGKEVIAKYIHCRSRRREKDLVAINCYGLSDGLVESELFGHARGAFSGATHDRKGFFEVAKGSTLFLDEIGDATPSFQGKLLRVLQEKKMTRVGETKEIQVDVRVIAATHREVADASAAKPFRKDLLERLRVLTLRLPALRERVEDIPALTDHIARAFVRCNSKQHPDVPNFAPEAIRLLQEQPWTGNVRELQSVIKRALIAGHDDTIGAEEIRVALSLKGDSDRPPLRLVMGGGSPMTLEDEVREFKLRRVEEVLAAVGGNKTEAAEILGISRKCLYDILATKKRCA